MVLVLRIGIFKKDNLPWLRIKDTIILSFNMKKKIINMTRPFRIHHSEWHLCYMFKSSIFLLPHSKFSNLNSRSTKIYKLLTKR